MTKNQPRLLDLFKANTGHTTIKPIQEPSVTQMCGYFRDQFAVRDMSAGDYKRRG